MNLIIRNTIEDYRDVYNYMYEYIIEEYKKIFTTLKIIIYLAPLISLLLQREVLVNREYNYLIPFIIISVIVEVLFYLILKNKYPIKWLVNLDLIKVKRSKFAVCDKVLEIDEKYIKIFNKYGEVIFNKKNKSEVIRFNKGLIINNKVDNKIKKFIFIPNRSFKDDNEINQLVSCIKEENR